MRGHLEDDDEAFRCVASFTGTRGKREKLLPPDPGWDTNTRARSSGSPAHLQVTARA